MEELYKLVINRYHVLEFENFSDIEEFKKIEQNFLRELPIDEVPINLEGVLIDASKNKNIPINHWKIIKGVELRTEENFKKQYGNICSSVWLIRNTILVTKNEDKISLKIFTYNRTREKGKVFFRVKTRVDYFTYNKKTNSFYSGWLSDYHKKTKIKKSIRKNTFYLNPLQGIYIKIKDVLLSSDILNKKEIIDIIFNTFYNEIDGSNKYSNLPVNQRFYGVFFDKVNIKKPNNWNLFYSTHPFINMKIVKKNNMNLIDSYMDVNGLNGDKIKKVLHLINKSPELSLFKWCNNFFGKDFILGQSVEFITKLLTSDFGYIHINDNEIGLSKKEKHNIFSILNLVLLKYINRQTFFDHLDFRIKIAKYEEIKWKSNTYETFRDEHLEFTDRYDFYTKGEYHRIYSNDFIELVEDKILDNYYPVLLKTSNDYNMESFYQSNCVKSYVSRPSSIIISLRVGNNESKERATLEYKVNKRNDQIFLTREQSLGRYNSNLNEDWEKPLKILDTRISELVLNDIFKPYTCNFKIGYEVKTTKTIFVKNLNLHEYHPYGYVLDWEDENFNMYDGSPVGLENPIAAIN
jgi:hypothetical protein